MSAPKSALIVGASRGLGLGLAKEFLNRGWKVVGTVRDGKKTKLHDMSNEANGRLEIESIDITETSQISSLKSRLSDKKFDVLFVNAGIANPSTENIGNVSTEEFVRVLVTNTLSTMRVVDALTENVTADGTIGVMSSGSGSIADNEKGGYEIYRASKAALNTLMRSFAARRGQDRTLLLIAPGWTKTDMGGPEASFSVDEVIPQVVDTILGQEGKKGLQYLDRFGKTIRW